MHKITRIKIRGFQSHIETEIKLAQGLTVITGPSGNGKTAIIRAVKWVAFGEPAGEAFVNAQVGEAEVEIELEDGVTITKKRRGKKTTYQVSTIAEPFEKAEVPLEVTQALGITKQSFSEIETALNFAFQLEAPFLLSEAASVGAKVLGKLAGTEIVDMATKAVSKETHAARVQRSQAEKDIEARETDLLAYIGLEEIEEQIAAAEYLVEQAAKNQGKYEKLVDLATKAINAGRIIARADAVLDKLMILPQLEEDIQNIEKAQQRYDRLLDLGGRLNKTKDDIQRLESLLTTFAGLSEAAQLVGRLETYSDRLTKLASLSKQYQAAVTAAKQADVILEQTAHLDEAQDAVRRTETALERLTTLEGLRHRLMSTQDAVRRCDEALAHVADIALVPPLIAEIETNLKRSERLTALKNQYDIKHRTRQTAEANETAAAQTIEAIRSELDQVWADLKVCPLCDQPVASHSH